MREERLIERIRIREKNPARSATEDPNKIIDSILKHLQKILNTRRGSVPIAADFGVPDFTDFLRAYPDTLREVEQSLRQTISKYEPRLKAVRVNFIPNEEDVFSLSFQIFGKLAGDYKDRPVMFESMMGYDGKISIRS